MGPIRNSLKVTWIDNHKKKVGGQKAKMKQEKKQLRKAGNYFVDGKVSPL